MYKEDEIFNCMCKHMHYLFYKMIKDIYITEENYVTIKGKYFNLIYIKFYDKCYANETVELFDHCCVNHV